MLRHYISYQKNIDQKVLQNIAILPIFEEFSIQMEWSVRWTFWHISFMCSVHYRISCQFFWRRQQVHESSSWNLSLRFCQWWISTHQGFRYAFIFRFWRILLSKQSDLGQFSSILTGHNRGDQAYKMRKGTPCVPHNRCLFPCFYGSHNKIFYFLRRRSHFVVGSLFASAQRCS